VKSIVIGGTGLVGSKVVARLRDSADAGLGAIGLDDWRSQSNA
jgi:hypothetical protein